MANRRISLVLVLLLGFAAGIVVCIFGPRILRRWPLSSSHRPELLRVNSVNGRFDAVLVLEQYGGALGGQDWYVYIVQKGKAVPPGTDSVFWASELDHEKIVWKQPHQIEIQYDVAEILGFRNLWCSSQVEDVGAYGQSDYCVEIRLTPSTPDFSILDSNGAFRHIHAD